MSETLKSIIDSYRSGLLSTTNIEVFEKKLSDKTIKFPSELITSITFDCSTFQNSDLINMEFTSLNADALNQFMSRRLVLFWRRQPV